jgi:hypothetical protein
MARQAAVIQSKKASAPQEALRVILANLTKNGAGMHDFIAPSHAAALFMLRKMSVFAYQRPNSHGPGANPGGSSGRLSVG